jgi:hypothetical protein
MRASRLRRSGVVVPGNDLAWKAGDIRLVDIMLMTLVMRSTESKMLSNLATAWFSITTTSILRLPVARVLSEAWSDRLPLCSSNELNGDAAKVADSSFEN